jgi:hypothetical protein
MCTIFWIIPWKHLRPYVGSEHYQKISAELQAKSIEMAHQMPFPVTINRAMLERVYPWRDIAGVMGSVSMFQIFLPGLIIDGEFFKRLIR